MGYLPALRYLLHHGIDHYVGDELKTNSYPVLLPSTEKKGRARPGDCRTPAHVGLPIVRSRCKHATYLSLDVGERPNGHGLPFYGLERRRRTALRSLDGGAPDAIWVAGGVMNKLHFGDDISTTTRI